MAIIRKQTFEVENCALSKFYPRHIHYLKEELYASRQTVQCS